MSEPGPDDIQPVAHETLDRIVTGTVTVVPFLALGVVGWQVWDELLHWSDIAVFAILYVLTGFGVTVGFHRLFTHRAFATKPLAARRPRRAAARRRSRARSSRGSPTTASTTPSPTSRGRPAQPARRPRRAAGAARCAAWCTRTSAGCSSTPSAAPRKRYAPDLLADPVVSFVDRTFLVWALGGLGARVRARLADRRHARRPRSPACCGAAPCGMLVLHHVTYTINSLCHFFGAPALRHRRRVAQPRVAVAAHVRRGVAQQPPRLPDLRRATGMRWLRVRPLAPGHPRAREARPRVGRRAHRARSASAQKLLAETA